MVNFKISPKLVCTHLLREIYWWFQCPLFITAWHKYQGKVKVNFCFLFFVSSKVIFTRYYWPRYRKKLFLQYGDEQKQLNSINKCLDLLTLNNKWDNLVCTDHKIKAGRWLNIVMNHGLAKCWSVISSFSTEVSYHRGLVMKLSNFPYISCFLVVMLVC